MTIQDNAKDHIQEIQDLVMAGDIDLKERREAFRKQMGRETTLSDELLIAAIAATDDDDDELFAAQVMMLEGSFV